MRLAKTAFGSRKKGTGKTGPINGKQDEQLEDKQDSTGDAARIRSLIKEGRELIKMLNSSVTNCFRRNPEVLAKWHTASHIQRSPRKRDEEPATPPAPPAPPAPPVA